MQNRFSFSFLLSDDINCTNSSNNNSSNNEELVTLEEIPEEAKHHPKYGFFKSWYTEPTATKPVLGHDKK